MSEIDIIKRINKNVVLEDGKIISFDKQLIQLMSGVFDTRYPLVIAPNTMSLSYINDLNPNNCLVMNSSTVIKLREKHDLGFEFVSNCERYLQESLLAFESYKHETSKVILLREVDDDGFPMVAICRQDKRMGNELYVNEIPSIYDKQNLERLITHSYEKDQMFFKNKKIEQYVRSIGLQLPKGCTYALSDSYDKQVFNKSQVERDYAVHLHKTNKRTLHKDDDFVTRLKEFQKQQKNSGKTKEKKRSHEGFVR